MPSPKIQSLLDVRLVNMVRKEEFSQDALEYLNRNRSIIEPYTINYQGVDYDVHPNVFSPDIFEDTFFFMKELPWKPNHSFLEIGCGAGLVSIHAAHRGYRCVLATDISRHAVNNCNTNIKRHALQNIVEARISNVFSNIHPSEKFDQVFWNLPFIWSNREPTDDLEASLYDLHYRGLKQYLRNAHHHLSEDGEILLGFSDSSGHLEAIELLSKEQNYETSVLAEKSFDDGFKLQLFRFQ